MLVAHPAEDLLLLPDLVRQCPEVLSDGLDGLADLPVGLQGLLLLLLLLLQVGQELPLLLVILLLANPQVVDGEGHPFAELGIGLQQGQGFCGAKPRTPLLSRAELGEGVRRRPACVGAMAWRQETPLVLN